MAEIIFLNSGSILVTPFSAVPVSTTYDIGNGSDRLLVVGAFASATSTANATVSSITYNGVNLTNLDQCTITGPGSAGRLELWYALDASLNTGSNTLEVTWGGTVGESIVGIASYGNVSQSAPTEYTSSGLEVSETSLDINSDTSQSVVLEFFTTNPASSIVQGSGQTESFEVSVTTGFSQAHTYLYVDSGSVSVEQTGSTAGAIFYNASTWAPTPPEPPAPINFTGSIDGTSTFSGDVKYTWFDPMSFSQSRWDWDYDNNTEYIIPTSSDGRNTLCLSITRAPGSDGVYSDTSLHEDSFTREADETYHFHAKFTTTDITGSYGFGAWDGDDGGGADAIWFWYASSFSGPSLRGLRAQVSIGGTLVYNEPITGSVIDELDILDWNTWRVDRHSTHGEWYINGTKVAAYSGSMPTVDFRMEGWVDNAAYFTESSRTFHEMSVDQGIYYDWIFFGPIGAEPIPEAVPSTPTSNKYSQMML